MPKVKINETEIEVPAGTNMIEAARLAGIEIPHYCYHPHLTIAGNCRMCLVDIEAGGRGPDIACNMQARDGLHIRTDSERVKTMRKSVMEFLLVNHPLDCPICDQAGECRLQDYYMDYGEHDSRSAEEKVGKGKRQDIGEHIVLDAERCVQCSRCVRFSDEVTGTGELRLFNRGNHTEIGIFPGERLSHSYQGNLADICPVGALTNKEFRFKKRVWFLREERSVCTGCSTGCNIRVCHEQGEVHRVLPRRNDKVNKSWMCDFGRASSAKVATMDRIITAKLGGKTVEVPEAANAAALALKGAKVGVIFGSMSSNEANFALVRLLGRHLGGARRFLVEGNDPAAFTAPADKILIDADRTPNRRGAQAIGGSLEGGAALKAALAAGEIDALLVLEDDVVGRLQISAPKALIYVGSLRNKTSDAATHLLPAAHTVEQECSFTNRQGRVQRARQALPPSGDSLPAWRLVNEIARSLGGTVVGDMPATVFRELADANPAFSGMNYKGLGSEGQLLAAPAEGQSPTAK